MKYLIYTQKSRYHIGAIIDIPANWTSDDYGECQRQFCLEYGEQPKGGHSRGYAEMVRLRETDKTPNGIYFDWGLAGPDGAWFHLIILPDTTTGEAQIAEQYLRRERDVVRLQRLHVHEIVKWHWSPVMA